MCVRWYYKIIEEVVALVSVRLDSSASVRRTQEQCGVSTIFEYGAARAKLGRCA